MSIYESRLEKLKSKMHENSLNAFYTSNLTNIRYLSGFTGSSGFLLITENGDHIFSDGRYTEQSKHEILNQELHITTNHLLYISNFQKNL